MAVIWRYVPIAGTHEKRSAWCSPGSDFEAHMSGQGFTRHRGERAFWSRALAGTCFTRSGHRVWTHGGAAVAAYFSPWTPAELRRTVVIAHSYGGAVLAYALAGSAQMRRSLGAIITVGTPLRRDLDRVWLDASSPTLYHAHLYGTGLGSRIRFFGQRARLAREMPWADLNVAVHGGHSGLLRDPSCTPQIDPVLDVIRRSAAR